MGSSLYPASGSKAATHMVKLSMRHSSVSGNQSSSAWKIPKAEHHIIFVGFHEIEIVPGA